MTASSRSSRRTLIAASALALLLSATACSPEPAATPSPTPTGFATEEEAFAAAEETYRAYNAAANLQMNGRHSEDSYEYLTGSALDQERASAEEFETSGIQLTGEATVKAFAGISTSLGVTPQQAEADVCIDVSGTRLLNSAGQDVTPAGRPTTSTLRVTFVADDARGFLISESNLSTDQSC